MSTLTTLRADGPTTAERKHNAESLVQRKLAITDSARERVRSKLIDIPIEDSPIKRDWPRRGRDEQVKVPRSSERCSLVFLSVCEELMMIVALED